MALIYDAELTPGKLQVIAAWLAEQPWSGVEADAELERITSFRFDDPADEVGLEVTLVRVPGGEAFIQVPLTYRGEPLEGAESHFVAKIDHSVLGERWVYDATADPVFLAELERAIRYEKTNAREFVHSDDDDKENEERTDVASVTGVVKEDMRHTGRPTAETLTVETRPSPNTIDGVTMVRAGDAELEILRFPQNEDGAGHTVIGRLVATWDGQSTPVQLARLVTR